MSELEEGTSVHGVVRATKLAVAGTIVGQVFADELHVRASGRIHGQLKVQSLRVEGRVHGQVETQRLEVLDGGLVDAEVQAEDVDIQGQVQGRVTASRRISLSETADAQCELRAPELNVARGARLRAGLGTQLPTEAAAPIPSAVPEPAESSASDRPRKRRILVRRKR